MEETFYKLKVWRSPAFDAEHQDLLYYKKQADKAASSKQAEGHVLDQREKSKSAIGSLIASYFDEVLADLQELKNTLDVNIQQQETVFESLGSVIDDFNQSLQIGKDFVK